MARSAPYKVTVLGTAEVITQFRRLGFKTSDLHMVFGQIAADVAATARMLAPKRSGRLAADVRAGSAKTKATVMVGRSSVPYAGPINYGWAARGIAPSLFMQKAADPKAATAGEDINREIKRLIRQSGLG
jgi:hypothetical protein